MKRALILPILLLCLVFGLFAQQEWLDDAVRADNYYNNGDFDAAWLFYERALAGGCDDGLVLYRAAESFRRQEIEEIPDFGEALYALSHYFLLEQYPDNPARHDSKKYFDTGIIVNRRFLKDTYSVVGGKAPKIRNPVVEGLGAITGFFGAQMDRLGSLWQVLRTQGIREALSWIRARFFHIVFAWLVLSAFTGIILPVVMALTVAREGRKSYVTAYLFLAHWGVFGIHRFYLGRYLSGVIWLLTGGLLGIGVFFDIFLTGAYVRFWNEDNKDDRPAARASTRDSLPRPSSKPYKLPKTKKPKKVKQAKPPKSVKAKPAKPAKSVKTKGSTKTDRPAAARSVSTESEAARSIADEADPFTAGAAATAGASMAGVAASSIQSEFAANPDGLPDDLTDSEDSDFSLDDDFGDFSDISFDGNAVDALNSPSDSGADGFDAGLSESFDEDELELDLKSFE